MAWDKSKLVKFRKDHGLSKRELARRLQAQGLPTASDRTIARWEEGVTPHPAIQKVLDDALDALRKASRKH